MLFSEARGLSDTDEKSRCNRALDVRRAAINVSVAFAGTYQLVAPDAEAGGGVLGGGVYTAFATIAASAAATPSIGGIYEVTPGIERRRDNVVVPDHIFANGFE